MKKQLSKVEKFHEMFKLGIEKKPVADLEENRSELRYDLMKEENEEYLDAVKDKNIVEVADALGDMLYILCGTIIEHGMASLIEKVFDEIHESNMSKLGENGKPIYREDGKVMKGPNYFKPDISKIIELNCKIYLPKMDSH